MESQPTKRTRVASSRSNSVRQSSSQKKKKRKRYQSRIGAAKKARKIPVGKPLDPNRETIDCLSDVIKNRIDRIEQNYVTVDELLNELEQKIPQPEPVTEELADESTFDPKKPR